MTHTAFCNKALQHCFTNKFWQCEVDLHPSLRPPEFYFPKIHQACNYLRVIPEILHSVKLLYLHLFKGLPFTAEHYKKSLDHHLPQQMVLVVVLVHKASNISDNLSFQRLANLFSCTKGMWISSESEIMMCLQITGDVCLEGWKTYSYHKVFSDWAIAVTKQNKIVKH